MQFHTILTEQEEQGADNKSHQQSQTRGSDESLRHIQGAQAETR